MLKFLRQTSKSYEAKNKKPLQLKLRYPGPKHIFWGSKPESRQLLPAPNYSLEKVVFEHRNGKTSVLFLKRIHCVVTRVPLKVDKTCNFFLDKVWSHVGNESIARREQQFFSLKNFTIDYKIKRRMFGSSESKALQSINCINSAVRKICDLVLKSGWNWRL